MDIRLKNIVFCDPGNLEIIKSWVIIEMQAVACSERWPTVKPLLQHQQPCQWHKGLTQNVQSFGRLSTVKWLLRAIAQQTQAHILKCEDTWKKKWSQEVRTFLFGGKKNESTFPLLHHQMIYSHLIYFIQIYFYFVNISLNVFIFYSCIQYSVLFYIINGSNNNKLVKIARIYHVICYNILN